jgi:hypothetical protein
MSKIMCNQNQDGGKKDFDPKSTLISVEDPPWDNNLLRFSGISADFGSKSFFSHLDFNCTLLKTCLGKFYPVPIPRKN